MNFKKVILILVLLFSFTWAVNPGGKADGDTDDEISSDEEEDEAGKP